LIQEKGKERFLRLMFGLKCHKNILPMFLGQIDKMNITFGIVVVAREIWKLV
jgi:hypothetical protein